MGLKIVAFFVILAITRVKSVIKPDGSFESKPETKAVVDKILKNSPIIDGHNDLATNFRVLAQNDLSKVDFSSDLTKHPWWYTHENAETHTDLVRMKASGYGGQFWAVFTECTTQMKDSVEQTLETIDFLKRLVRKYPEHLHWATSSKDIEEALKLGKIASLMGVEGGHSIQSNYGILRMLYELGARYLTLTHTCNTPWADGSPSDQDNPSSPNFLLREHNGLTTWGLGLIDELNRIGMMVDLSHTSEKTMLQAIKRSKAPIIFSHSGARAVYGHHRNVPDDVLELVKSTGSIVMLNYYSAYLKKDHNNTTIADVIAHAEHIKKIAGVDCMGLGGDFDGVEILPKDLEHPGKVRNLLEALYETGTWTEEDLEKLTSKNIRRVFAKVEEVRDSLKGEEPKQDALPVPQYWNSNTITQNFF